MDDVRIPPAGDPFTSFVRRSPSTRHHRCDHDFLELLEEDYGISQFALRSAFMGVPAAPKRQAIELCEWAIRVSAGDPEEAGNALRAWARKRKTGTYSPRMHDQEPPMFGGREQGGRLIGG